MYNRVMRAYRSRAGLPAGGLSSSQPASLQWQTRFSEREVFGEPAQTQMVPSHQAIITPFLMRYNKSTVCFHFTVDSYVPFLR